MSERRLRRFFTSTSLGKKGEKVLLPPSETVHLKKILRLKEGDLCLVTDGNGKEAEALVSSFSGEETVLVIHSINTKASHGTASLGLHLYPAMLQKGKMDDLVRQMQELGADGFFPVETDRTIVKMEADAKSKMAGRWEKIVREAAKQSGSLNILKVHEPVKLEEALRKLPAGATAAVFHPDALALPFSDWIKGLSKETNLHLFFGPEGGFSDKEMELFKTHKISCVRLGSTILKADTAMLGVASALKFLFQ
jgi:16S rRNA (uracil1498-N3)-methyltransferase